MIIIDSYKYRKYLLDLFPATVAYSLRKLRAGQTRAIRVRRSSDNAEQDIGFVGDELNTASLLSFCGVGDGFVHTWYDSSVNGYNATQTTQANQPQIVSSGAVITDNGKPAIQFDGTDDTLGMSVNITMSMISSVFNWNNKTNYEAIIGSIVPGVPRHIFGLDTSFVLYTSIASLFSSPSSNYWVNGVNTLTTGNGQKLTTAGSNSVTARLIMGDDTAGGHHSNGRIQEIIAYTNTANRTAIESDINIHYSIY